MRRPVWSVLKFTAWLLVAAVPFFLGFQSGRWEERKHWQPLVRAVVQEIDRTQRMVDDVSAHVAEMVLVVTHCESSNRHDGVYGDGGKAYGIAQFWEETFYRMARLMGRPELRWKNKRDQLTVLSWAIRNGYAREWTCSRLING